MGDDRKRSSRVLRFAVTGALLVAPVATGCGDEEQRPTINEPAPEPTVNVAPPEPDGPVVPETPPTVNNPPEPHPTPNTPAQPPSE